jgi:Mn-dependent DtxR family transcriptional regulator
MDKSQGKSQVTNEVSNYGHGEVITPKGERNQRTIYVTDAAWYEDMKAKAKEMEMSISELIRRALIAYTSEDKTCPVCQRTAEILRVSGAFKKVKKAK